MSEPPVIVYLGIGGNVGDRVASLTEALRRLSEEPEITVTRSSSFYETAPVGMTEQPNFLNAAVEIQTTLTPGALLAAVLGIEEKMGRRRTVRWGPRVIDIDILLYGSEEIRQAGLTVPHPRLAERAFALTPLAEIAPRACFPDGETAQKKLHRLAETGNNVSMRLVQEAVCRCAP